MQEALIKALAAWEDDPPADPTGWLITVAWRAFLDLTRSETARRDREVRFDTEPPAGTIPSADDTLRLYFLCAHPDLTPSSAVALTLRAVGGLTTRQIAEAYLVPEATMAQRISRAKRTVSEAGARPPRRRRHGDEGALPRLQRGLLGRRRPRRRGDPAHPAAGGAGGRPRGPRAARADAPPPRPPPQPHPSRTAASCRSPSRTAASGTPTSSPRGSSSSRRRSLATGSASTRRKRRSPRSTPTRRASRRPTGSRSWSGTTSCSGSPTRRSSGSTARSRWARPTARPPGWRRWPRSTKASRGASAVAAHLHEKNGDLERAARLYADAARNAPNLAERDHQTRQAARLNQQLRGSQT